MDIEDTEACYRAVKSRDRRFDGVFYTGVTSTGIYCRPVVPGDHAAAKSNVTFHRTAAAAQAAGFRACKRCLPDATPGSPDWDVAADVAGRAMRLIADGVVEREGVEGLAARVGYTPRHLNRLLTAELGAGPLALARARRAQTARVLIETTADGASPTSRSRPASPASGSSTTPIREVYAAHADRAARGASGATAPRRRRRPGRAAAAVRAPFAGRGAAALPGRARGRRRRARAARTGTRAPCGCRTAPARVRLTFPPTRPATGTPFVRCLLASTTCATSAAAVERCRRLLDADCDPVAVDDALGADPRAGPAGAARVPGCGCRARRRREVAVRAVLGQQISRGRGATARRPARRRATATQLPATRRTTDRARLFPTAGRAGRASTPTSCRCRGPAAAPWSALCRRARRRRGRARPQRRPRRGPRPAARAARHRAVDRRLRRAARAGRPRRVPADRHRRPHGPSTGLGARPADAPRSSAERWRPWRSYALMHLWSTLDLRRPRPRTTTHATET